MNIVTEGAATAVAALRAERGEGEIWLFGGGTLFRSLLEAGQVDRIDVTVVPILLGGGVPLLPPGGARMALRLIDTRTYRAGWLPCRTACEIPPPDESAALDGRPGTRFSDAA